MDDDEIAQPPGTAAGGSYGPADAPTSAGWAAELPQPATAPNGTDAPPPSSHDSLPTADSESLSSFSVGLSVRFLLSPFLVLSRRV